MPFKTIFTDEMIEQYTKQGFWGRGTFLDHFERNVERFRIKNMLWMQRGEFRFQKCPRL